MCGGGVPNFACDDRLIENTGELCRTTTPSALLCSLMLNEAGSRRRTVFTCLHRVHCWRTEGTPYLHVYKPRLRAGQAKALQHTLPYRAVYATKILHPPAAASSNRGRGWIGILAAKRLHAHLPCPRSEAHTQEPRSPIHSHFDAHLAVRPTHSQARR